MKTKVAFSLRLFAECNGVDGRNVPSTATDRDQTCENVGDSLKKSNIEGVLWPSTACTLLGS